MTLRVPTNKAEAVGMRKLSSQATLTEALTTLKGKPRIKRTMWSRRAQEYEAKINSGDLVSIAEVVRDLHRAEDQPEQSYSERQIYEAAIGRLGARTGRDGKHRRAGRTVEDRTGAEGRLTNRAPRGAAALVRQHGAAVFKYTVYALLLINVGLLFRAAADEGIAPYKALDQIGWLLILGVFEWETRQPAADGGRRRLLGAPLAVELLGYGFALYALANYWNARIWLDVVNSIVWLAISATIWLDILRPVGAAAGAHKRRNIAKFALYSGTFICAVLWGIEGALLDFYDAALWILCFFAIEMNLLRFVVPVRRSLASQ